MISKDIKIYSIAALSLLIVFNQTIATSNYFIFAQSNLDTNNGGLGKNDLNNTSGSGICDDDGLTKSSAEIPSTSSNDKSPSTSSNDKSPSTSSNDKSPTQICENDLGSIPLSSVSSQHPADVPSNDINQVGSVPNGIISLPANQFHELPGDRIYSDQSGSPSVSCGEVIKESIMLNSNLDCKKDAILVGSDNIVIDLNGHTISGPGISVSSVGVMVGDRDNVIVKGPGIIENFQVGVLNTGGQSDRISGLTFSNNHIGSFNTGSEGTVFDNNMFFENGIGIASHSAKDSQLSTNLFKSNDLAGITFVNSETNNVIMNTVLGAINGVFIDNQSSNNNIVSNTILNNQEVDLNNGNGLPLNINNNTFNNNNCYKSMPVGLCYGNEQTVTDDNKLNEPVDEHDSNPSAAGTLSNVSPNEKSTGFLGETPSGSANNINLQSQTNSGNNVASQGAGSDSGSGAGSDSGSGAGSDSGSGAGSDSGSGAGSDSGSGAGSD
ncbi:MAG: right-handed parallel beta-helix repeat-containing protein, partial [Thermoproteota archaeon]|nr:right-handed parallel beta-helix repeat-containing protein [Thermoproteota archaeon]